MSQSYTSKSHYKDKIRRSYHDHLIFMMGIPILGKTIFVLKQGPDVNSAHILWDTHMALYCSISCTVTGGSADIRVLGNGRRRRERLLPWATGAGRPGPVWFIVTYRWSLPLPYCALGTQPARVFKCLGELSRSCIMLHTKMMLVFVTQNCWRHMAS